MQLLGGGIDINRWASAPVGAWSGVNTIAGASPPANYRFDSFVLAFLSAIEQHPHVTLVLLLPLDEIVDQLFQIELSFQGQQVYVPAPGALATFPTHPPSTDNDHQELPVIAASNLAALNGLPRNGLLAVAAAPGRQHRGRAAPATCPMGRCRSIDLPG